ncbi:hypothetical protein JRQ81_006714 [Phrynocephalus forsythii]|uniref:Uncharacterized protein n=1 Tax=Phrynocephalus forsythii TaxID=171643 RepID=A0A9Q0XDI4_9SAUR|nr:hypothetical protein JRQ81_006714 [Phrynocephalus forsythii]
MAHRGCLVRSVEFQPVVPGLSVLCLPAPGRREEEEEEEEEERGQAGATGRGRGSVAGKGSSRAAWSPRILRNGSLRPLQRSGDVGSGRPRTFRKLWRASPTPSAWEVVVGEDRAETREKEKEKFVSDRIGAPALAVLRGKGLTRGTRDESQSRGGGIGAEKRGSGPLFSRESATANKYFLSGVTVSKLQCFVTVGP